jgi:hypothetical protein
MVTKTVMMLLRILGILRLEPRQGLAKAAEHVWRFFDAQLERSRSAG